MVSLVAFLALQGSSTAVFPGGGASKWASWLSERSGGLAVVAFDTEKPWPSHTFAYRDDADLRRQVAAFTGYEVTAHAMYPREYPDAIRTEEGTSNVLAGVADARGLVRKTESGYRVRPPETGYVVLSSLLGKTPATSLGAKAHWSVARWPLAVYAENKPLREILLAIAEATGSTLRDPVAPATGASPSSGSQTGEAPYLDLDVTAFRLRAGRLAARTAEDAFHRAFQEAGYAEWSDEDLAKAMAKRNGGLWRRFAAYPRTAGAGRRYFDDQTKPGTTHFSAAMAERIRRNVDFSRDPQVVFEVNALRFSVYIRGREFAVSI